MTSNEYKLTQIARQMTGVHGIFFSIPGNRFMFIVSPWDAWTKPMQKQLRQSSSIPLALSLDNRVPTHLGDQLKGRAMYLPYRS